MFSTPGIWEYASLSSEINRRYCQHHNYRFVHEVSHRFSLAPQHEKVLLLRKHLPWSDYVFWIDSDACFIDFRKPITNFCQSGADLVIAGHDCGFDLQGRRTRYRINGHRAGLNTGVMLFRNSKWSVEFLENWWNRCVSGQSCHQMHEQGELQEMLMTNEFQALERTELITPSSRLNRCDDEGADICEYVLHLWGTGNQFRRDVFRDILDGNRPDISVDMPSFCVSV